MLTEMEIRFSLKTGELLSRVIKLDATVDMVVKGLMKSMSEPSIMMEDEDGGVNIIPTANISHIHVKKMEKR